MLQLAAEKCLAQADPLSPGAGLFVATACVIRLLIGISTTEHDHGRPLSHTDPPIVYMRERGGRVGGQRAALSAFPTAPLQTERDSFPSLRFLGRDSLTVVGTVVDSQVTFSA